MSESNRSFVGPVPPVGGQKPTVHGVFSPSEQDLSKNFYLERVFRFSLDSEIREHQRFRPTTYVYLPETASDPDNNLLNLKNLNTALFERTLLSDLSGVLRGRLDDQRNDGSLMGPQWTKLVFYLFECFCRSFETDQAITQEEMSACQSTIVQNLCLFVTTPDMYPDQEAFALQLLNVLLEINDSSREDQMISFLHCLADRIAEESDRKNFDSYFHPFYTLLKKHIADNCDFNRISLLRRYIRLLRPFVSNVPLGLSLISQSSPANPMYGKGYETSGILGVLLGFSCLPANPFIILSNQDTTFYQNSSKKTLQHLTGEDNIIFEALQTLHECLFDLFERLVRLKGTRGAFLTWMAKCLRANDARRKLWVMLSSDISRIVVLASDGFLMNLAAVMLKLCEPFCTPCNPKLFKVDYRYLAVPVGSPHVHLTGLHDDTCLVPRGENWLELVGKPSAEPNFMTEIFFLTHYACYLSWVVLYEQFTRRNQEVVHAQEGFEDIRAQFGEHSSQATTFIERLDQKLSIYHCIRAVLVQPAFLRSFYNFSTATATWLCQLVFYPSMARSSFEPLNNWPLPSENLDTGLAALACLPEFLVNNFVDLLVFLSRLKPDLFEELNQNTGHVITFIMVFMGSSSRLRNPHHRAKLAEGLEAICPPRDDDEDSRSRRNTLITDHFYREQAFNNHPLIGHLLEVLLQVFVAIEVTGEAVDFDQKFSYRRPMYKVMQYCLQQEHHNRKLKEICAESEANMDASNPPLFLRFINLLVNDAIFLLDEALLTLAKVREMETARNAGQWAELGEQQRFENEQLLRRNCAMARSYNIMARYTVDALLALTGRCPSIFVHRIVCDRIASMLNYFLVYLVHPDKRKQLKVREGDVGFKPEHLVRVIVQMYLNLSAWDQFCSAVVSDERSFSLALFEHAEEVLRRITALNLLEPFADLRRRLASAQQIFNEEDEFVDEADNEFKDEIMDTLMSDPVVLPSGHIVDRSTIQRHLLSDQSDPFSREPMNMDDVKSAVDLKRRIDDWLAGKRAERAHNRSTNS